MLLSTPHLTKKIVLLTLLFASEAGGDIIMTPAGLNQTLKKMAQLKKEIESGSPPEKGEALFQLGVESEALASLINEEIAAHGMQEKPLIDLALKRSQEFGISISYSREKSKFFYDGKAFELYVNQEPTGKYVTAAKFNLIEKQFYQSLSTDVALLLKGVESKKEFLTHYPKFELSAEVHLFLAIDYRDLYRYYRDGDDVENREKYQKLTRRQFEGVFKLYPQSEQAGIAEKLWQRFNEEVLPPQ